MNTINLDKTQFKERVRFWADKTDTPVISITIRPMKTKWASYSTTGRLTFDELLMELNQDLRDYVIVHELLHFHVPNHGKLWKSLMRVHLGNYESKEAQLKEIARDKKLQQAFSISC